MTRLFDPEYDILYTADVARAGDDPRTLRRLHAQGHVHRIRRGAYALSTQWDAADARTQHIAHVLAAVHDSVRPVVIAGVSAAALWNAPTFTGFDSGTEFGAEVQVLDAYRGGGRSEPGVRRLTRFVELASPVVRFGVQVTDVARTAIDLSRGAKLPVALAVCDWAISVTNPDATTVSVIRDRLTQMGSSHGARPVWRALELAVPNSGSAGESFFRGVVHELGFERPVTQWECRDERGVMFMDLVWERVRVAVEFDGLVKYRDPRYLHGDALETIRREKERESRLRALGWTVVRATWADLQDPPRLARILAGAGVPRRLEFVRRE